MSRKKEKKAERPLPPVETPAPGWVVPLGIASSVGVIVLHVIGAFLPSGITWGFHHLAFLSTGWQWGIPLAMVLMLVPSVQRSLLAFVDGMQVRLHRLSKPSRWVIAACGLAAGCLVFWGARQATFFLGDGIFVMRSLTSIQSAEDIPRALQNAPLPGFLTWKVFQLLSTAEASPAQWSYQVASVALGVIALVVTAPLVRLMTTETTDRVLAYAFIMATGSVQEYFGYVENYAPAMLCVVVYVWLSLAFLKGKVHLFWPFMAFGVLFTCHFGFFYLGATLILLAVYAVRRGKTREVFLAALGSLVVTLILLWNFGYPPEIVKAIFLKEGGVHMVPLLTRSTGWHAYTMFSLWHALDLGNLYLLLSPFALLMVVVALLLYHRGVSVKTMTTVFFLVAGALSLSFTIAFNFDIGMSRDWDLVAANNMALIISAAYLWITLVPQTARRILLVVFTGITLFHTAAWVAVNAREDSSIARYSVLRDDRLWGAAALIYADEDLGGFYRDRGDFDTARKYYQEGLDIDSTNSRRWLAIASVYQSLNQEGNMMHAYLRAVATGTRSPEVQNSVISWFGSRGRAGEAIGALKEALQRDPGSIQTLYFLGSAYAGFEKQYDSAVVYFRKALEMNPNIPQLYQQLGYAYMNLRRFDEMQQAWETYLERAPNAVDADQIRRILGSTGR